MTHFAPQLVHYKQGPTEQVNVILGSPFKPEAITANPCMVTQSLGLRIAQNWSYLCILGLKVGMIMYLEPQGIGVSREKS